jgi:hypothetical protein
MKLDIEEDINRLNHGIRLLKVQYDQYFAGGLPRPPLELRWQLEKIIKRHENTRKLTVTQRFQFNTLVGRFNSFLGLWNKHARAIEEGRPVPGSPRRAAPAADPVASREAGAEAKAAGQAAIIAQQVIEGADAGRPELHDFFERYKDVCRSAGQAVEGMSYSSFAQQIARKTEAVKSRAQCDAVRLRLTQEDGRLRLTAQPIRRKREP